MSPPPVTRRALVQGALLSPLLLARPGRADEPPAAVHLAFGADPSTEVTVSWSTSASVEQARLDWGTDASYGSTATPESRGVKDTGTVYHHVRLTRLMPGTTYRYRLRHRGGESADAAFTTASTDPATGFRFTACGDQGTGDDAAAVAARVAALAPAFHLHAGDLCYANGTGVGGDDQDYDPSVWDAWLAQNATAAEAGVPWMPAVGNHEMEPGFGPQGYDGFLGRFALPGNGVPGGPTTWSFRYGIVGVVALDANDASYELPFNRGWLGARQDAWLGETLRRLRADDRVEFVVVVFHHCAYSSNPAHGSDGGVRARWTALFDEHAVDLVINGHNHCYERTHPVRAGEAVVEAPRGATVRPAEHGTTYVTAGYGGRPLNADAEGPATTYAEEDGDRVPEQASWSAVTAGDHGVLVVDARPRRGDGPAELRVRALSTAGEVLDEVTLQHAAGGTAGTDLTVPLAVGGAAAVAGVAAAVIRRTRERGEGEQKVNMNAG